MTLCEAIYYEKNNSERGFLWRLTIGSQLAIWTFSTAFVGFVSFVFIILSEIANEIEHNDENFLRLFFSVGMIVIGVVFHPESKMKRNKKSQQENQ